MVFNKKRYTHPVGPASGPNSTRVGPACPKRVPAARIRMPFLIQPNAISLADVKVP